MIVAAGRAQSEGEGEIELFPCRGGLDQGQDSTWWAWLGMAGANSADARGALPMVRIRPTKRQAQAISAGKSRVPAWARPLGGE